MDTNSSWVKTQQQQQQQALHINPPPLSAQGSGEGRGLPTPTPGAFPSWTEDELRLLEECMIRIPAEDSKNDLDRVIKISKILKTKNIRDIAQKIRSLTSTPVNVP